LGVNTLYAALRRSSWWLTPIFTPFQIVLQAVIVIQSWYKYTFGHVDWRGRDIKLVVKQPLRSVNYQPAENYRAESLGDFHVVRDNNNLEKHGHKNQGLH
jgi:hypothetical protein